MFRDTDLLTSALYLMGVRLIELDMQPFLFVCFIIALITHRPGRLVIPAAEPVGHLV